MTQPTRGAHVVLLHVHHSTVNYKRGCFLFQIRMFRAIYRQDYTGLQLLLSQEGANPEHTPKLFPHCTALSYAAALGDTQAVSLLVARKANINRTYKQVLCKCRLHPSSC